MSTKKTVDQQIDCALGAVLRSKSSLIKVSDLPTPWQYNSHIINGYRFTESHTHCLRSILRLHNESFNIWSHLGGSFFLFGFLMYGGPPVPINSTHRSNDGSNIAAASLFTVVYYTYLLAAVLCTVCSASWHTMRCIASHSTMSCFSSIDLMGVTTLVIASVLVTQFVAFADAPAWQLGYMAASLVLGAAALTSCWHPVMCRPENSWTRVLVWIGLVVQGLAVPVAHLLWWKGPQRAMEVYGPLMPAYGPILLGAVVYASQFPECFWPGRFDYLGASHNILHVLSLWAIWLGLGALRDLHRTAGAGV